MVTIVTGKINANKTTKMITLYEANSVGDGFVSVKNMIQDTVHSYDAMQLSTKDKSLLIKRDIFFDDDFTVLCHIGPYLFSKETVNTIYDKIKIMVKNKISPIYLDEIGVLELENSCFHNLIVYLKNHQVDMVLSVREDLLEDIIKHYDFKDVHVIESHIKRSDIDV